MRMKLRAQLSIGYIVTFALMLGVAGVLYQSIYSLLDTQAWVAHTHEVVAEVHELEKSVLDMETGERGFAITGKDQFLEPYYTGQIQYREVMDNLKRLAADIRVQEELGEIDSVVREWHEKAAIPAIAARKGVAEGKSSMDAVAALIQVGTGKAIMDEFRDRIADILSIEQELLVMRIDESNLATTRSIYVLFIGILLTAVLGVAAIYSTAGRVLRQVGGEPADIARMTAEISRGNLDATTQGDAKAATGILGSVKSMAESLKKTRGEVEAQLWLKTGLMKLNDAMRDELESTAVAEHALSEIASRIDAQLGALYLIDETKDSAALVLTSSYAYTKRKNLSNRFALGEGLVGQAAREKKQILVSNVPEDYVKVTSGLGEANPGFISVTPLPYQDRVVGVLEVGTLKQVADLQLDYLNQAASAIAISLEATRSLVNAEAARSRDELALALEQSQSLAAELQSQQEELQAANEELEEKGETLERQSHELQAANEELEEKGETLERQKAEVEQKNAAIERARQEVEETAKDLAQASKYKSEFLANMSHELRTPLNSLLILAESLVKNAGGNLTPDQVESAGVIHGSGQDLLRLINDILDLSKVEAGKMDAWTEEVEISSLLESIERQFKPVANERGLAFNVEIADDVPSTFATDRQRAEQILKNLLANAFKFTAQGSVTLRIHRPDAGQQFRNRALTPETTIALSVIDTGIGVSEAKQREIFEAFQQGDGAANRKYGGTGLGLTISREMVRLLGGEIQLESRQGEGSRFTLYLPLQATRQPEAKPDVEPEPQAARPQTAPRVEPAPAAAPLHETAAPFLPDDRDQIEPGDRSMLIIEDDLRFAETLMKLGHSKGYKCMAADTGSGGLQLVSEHPPSAVLLDIGLPDIDGLAVLDQLKHGLKTRHIPVHVISAKEKGPESMQKGALGYLAKPASSAGLDTAFAKIERLLTSEIKHLLVVEDDTGTRKAIAKLLGAKNLDITYAASAPEARQQLLARSFDCVILDLGLGDTSGFELLRQMGADNGSSLPPVIVYTGRELTSDEHRALIEHARSIVVKGASSPERLLDEVSLFLHSVEESLPPHQRQIIKTLHDPERMLHGRRILLVDDDLRNTFALAKVLREHGLEVLIADNGQLALEKLAAEPDVDLVVMDIMMPVMDGYEAMRRIRAEERFRNLPIIALTAKAMLEDRAKCLEAGANDYLTKPIDIDRMLSMMRVWLFAH